MAMASGGSGGGVYTAITWVGPLQHPNNSTSLYSMKCPVWADSWIFSQSVLERDVIKLGVDQALLPLGGGAMSLNSCVGDRLRGRGLGSILEKDHSQAA